MQISRCTWQAKVIRKTLSVHPRAAERLYPISRRGNRRAATTLGHKWHLVQNRNCRFLAKHRRHSIFKCAAKSQFRAVSARCIWPGSNEEPKVRLTGYHLIETSLDLSLLCGGPNGDCANACAWRTVDTCANVRGSDC